MTPQSAQLQVQALAEAFAQADRIAGATEAGRDSARLVELASQAPVVRLVDVVLSEAVNRRASDVHIEAFERDVSIRYRIDGRCYQVAQPPKSLALAIASRIKVLASLDVAESRVPQDGRILLSTNNRQIDLRVSTLPTIHGESIVLRVLDKGSLDKTLAEIRQRALKQFQIIEVCIIHRTGEIPVGGNIVLIVTAAEHRAEAFRACRWCIDELKTITPIWKKETTPKGEIWIEERP